MPREIYEIVASAARYWFLFLMGLIVFRSFRWYWKDRKEHKKQLKLMPDAGYIGEMVVIQGEGELNPGDTLPVPWEGILGFTRINDLCIPAEGVKNKHCLFRYEEGAGLFLQPFSGRTIEVDGIAYESRKENAWMGHGSWLKIGQAILRLRMFAGYETEVSPAYAENLPEDETRFAPQTMPDPRQGLMWQQQMLMEMQQQIARQQVWMQRQEALRQQAFQQEYMRQQAYRQMLEQRQEEAASSATLEFHHQQPFYPVEIDWEDEPEAWEEEDLPPAEEAYQPETYDPEPDEDMTDAARPSRSMYVGEDESRHMRKAVWDRMLGGDRQ